MHSAKMKLNSTYFDKIRIDSGEPRSKPKRQPRPRLCEMSGCTAAGTHKAPKGRQAEGDYYWFCLDHVREYNKSYNYFSGMNDAAIQAFQKDATIGHRPTWQMGANAARGDTPLSERRAGGFAWTGRTDDPFRVLGDGFQARQPDADRRKVHNAGAKSLRTLGLDERATAAEVKARYKMLVKQHHPDANGGDRSSEDRLRDIIQAYSYLKSVGFC